MKLHWFVRKGFFFLPTSIPGWIIVLATLTLLIWLFIDIDSRQHSVSDTLINFVFNALIVAVVYSLIAFFASASNKE